MKRLSLISILVFAAGACSDGVETTNDTEQLQDALENTVDEVIVPTVGDFAQASAAMVDQARVFCSAPSESGLEDLQNEWRFLATEWNRTALYALGPLNQDLILPRVIFIESMRQRGTDYTETVREAIDLALSRTEPLDAAYFDNLRFTEVGLLALEVLIFETSGTASTVRSDVAAEFQTSGRKCAYLEGMAEHLERTADAVVRGWTESYLDSGTPFRDRLVRAELEDGSEPVPALLIAAFEHLDYVKRRKLEGILDAQLADHFYENLVATLDELVRFLDGGRYSFFDHMEARGFAAEVAQARDAIANARAIAAAEDRQALIPAWGEAEGFLKREVPNGLNVDLGLNFADGD